MNANMAVSFETFYYNQLLTRIEEKSPGKYAPEHLEPLQRLLGFLRKEDDAQSSIEKLAGIQSTSDLAIFFSDLLDHLRNTTPDGAMERVDSDADDFLEIFQVYLQSEEWRSLFNSAIFADSEPEQISAAETPPETDADAEVLDLAAYCRRRFESVLSEQSMDVALPDPDTFVDYARRLWADEQLAAGLAREGTPAAQLSALTQQLSPAAARQDSEAFLANFETNLSRWMEAFRSLYLDQRSQLEELFAPAAADSEEVPMEALFDAAEAETPAPEPEPAINFSETEEAMEELTRFREKQSGGELSEEEQERRQFLRDYVVSEIESYNQEILEALEKMEQNPADKAVLHQLNESLKMLKDLGQIHAYPRVEQIADQLKEIVNSLPAAGKAPNQQERSLVRQLLALMPKYVDAVIQNDQADILAAIDARQGELEQGLLKEEPALPLRSAEVRQAAFQQFVSQVSARLLSALQEKQPLAGRPELQSQLTNLVFWSELYRMPEAAHTAAQLQTLLSDPQTPLGPQQQQLAEEIISSWQNNYINAAPELWKEYADKLAAGEAPRESVGVDQAETAFGDTGARRIEQLIKQIEAGATLDSAFIERRLSPTFILLKENAQLLHNDDLEMLFRMLCVKLEGFQPEHLEDQAGYRRDLAGYLEELRDSLMNLPESPDTEYLLSAFDHIFRRELALTDTEEAPETEAEKTDEISPDEEIRMVFTSEAGNYLNDIRASLEKLQQEGFDQKSWHDLEVTAHTLKGAAQMVGREDIAEIAEPLDRVLEGVEHKDIPADPEFFELMWSLVDHLQRRLDGQSSDASQALAQLMQITAGEAETAPAEETVVPEIPAEQPALESEMIYLQEKDPEMLSIFRNEVANSFELVEKNLDNLEKFTYDKEALQQIERATHEIRAAAKMLGISEIAEITDRLETIFEMLVVQKIEDLHGTIPVSRRAMWVIRELTRNHQVDKAIYEEAMEKLDQVIKSQGAAEIVLSDIIPSAPATAKTAEPEPAPPAAPAPDVEPVPAAPVLALFLQEAHEQLDDINYLLLKLEKDPENLEMQNHLMRCLHTLKGSSAMVQIRSIEQLAHRSEDIVEYKIREKKGLPEDIFDLLFSVMDETTYILNALEEGGKEATKNFEPVLEQLNQYRERLGIAGGAAEAAEPIEEPAAEKTASLVTETEPASGKTGKKDTYLRLKITKMNHLLNLAAELVVSNNQFKTQLDRLKQFMPMLNNNLKLFRDTEDYLTMLLREENKVREIIDPLIESKPGAKEALKKQIDNLQRVLKNVRSLEDQISTLTHTIKENSKSYDENLQKLNKLSNELLDEIMQARLVPIDMLFQRFHRPIRDLAKKMKKPIRLTMEGGAVELDRALIDDLYEPVLHLIRNAIDHGLETAEERKSAGKPEEGHLEIKASRDRNQIIIEVRDDGRGIDLETVKRAAVEKGLLSEEDAGNMSEQELYEYLFYPGFSTAKETTMVSGRGVGLDAVKSQIEKAKGDIRIYTTKGKGTTFSIRVPISLSVIQSMLVDVSGHVYSIPLMQVEETLHTSGQDILSEEGEYYIRYRERKIPVIQLSNLLKIKNGKEKLIAATSSYPLIIVQDEGNRSALLVDKIIRREEILIKSLGPGLRRLKYISGGSIMADGQVVLVLDIPQIISDAMKARAGGSAATPAPERPAPLSRPPIEKKQVQGRKPSALIVDDSLSIRKYLSSLLMQKGFQTGTARNGYEALELLNKGQFDIMITDLEMPKLSGYELIETLRYDQRFNTLPIVVLTGRAGDNFRQLTTELGADAYMVKPFKDRELFEQIEKFIEYRN